MRLEFNYVVDDLKDVVAWHDKQRGRKANGLRGALGWLLFVIMSLFLFVWLKSNASRGLGAPAPAPLEPVSDIFLPALPWVAILFFIGYAVWVHARRHLTMWKRYTQIHQPHSLSLDEEGVRTSNLFIESHYRWPFFVGWGETPTIFVLVMPGDQWMIIPKRAIAEEGAVSQLRDILGTHIQKPVGGFPVEQPKPAHFAAPQQPGEAES